MTASRQQKTIFNTPYMESLQTQDSPKIKFDYGDTLYG